MRGVGLLRAPGLATATLAASLGVLAALAAPAHAATGWVTDPAHSRLEFVATQSGGEFQGRFNRFDADIVFDPRDLAGSRFHVTIQTASADTQDETRDKALVGDDFFAAGRWPTATFDATRFAASAGGQYEARGRLTIRGISRDVKVLFTFRPAPAADGAVLSGGATIRRLDFGVGQGEWQDTKWVGNDVRIVFELVLKPGTAGASAAGRQSRLDPEPRDPGAAEPGDA
jgi:polyisoprenoid-binding protein YceI